MTATLTCFVDDESRVRFAKLRARAFVGPTPGVVAVDDGRRGAGGGDDAGGRRVVAHLPDGTEANVRALAGYVLAPGERAAAIVATDRGSGTDHSPNTDDRVELGYVYQGRDGGGVQRLAAELGDGGDAGSDARAAIQRQFGLDVLADGTGLRERLRREYGDDHVRYDELHFYAQQLADAADPDTGLQLAGVRNDPEVRVRGVVADIDDDALTAALDAEDWEWLASLAADHTTRPPVAYEPDDHDVV